MQEHRPGAALVVARAVVLATAGLGSGVVAHVAGGGLLPPAATMLLLLALSVAGAAWWLRSWTRTPHLVLAVIVAQGVWHLLLSVLAGHAGGTAVPAVPSHHGSSEGVVAHQMAHVVDQGVLMVLAHLAGAALLGLFLARGEAALWRLATIASSRIRAALGSGAAAALWSRPVAPAVVRCPVVAPQVCHVEPLVTTTTHRRGPPVLLAA